MPGILGLLRLGRSFSKSARSVSQMKIRAKNELRAASLAGRNKNFGIRSSELLEEAAELKEQASEVIEAAFYDAMETMYSMTANPGQDAVFDQYIIPAFTKALANGNVDDGWEYVDIGEYMAFTGQIVDEGNNIMREAFDEAQSLMLEALDIEAEFNELFGES